jgi:hypothetical protein
VCSFTALIVDLKFSARPRAAALSMCAATCRHIACTPRRCTSRPPPLLDFMVQGCAARHLLYSFTNNFNRATLLDALLHDFFSSDEAIHKRWKQVETAAAVACHTHCVLAHSDAAKAVQDQLIQWFNQQPSENSYATVIWPRKNCPWAVSSRHLQSNIVDRGLCAIPSLQPSNSFCSQPSNSFCSTPIPNPSFTNFENQPLRIGNSGHTCSLALRKLLLRPLLRLTPTINTTRWRVSLNGTGLCKQNRVMQHHLTNFAGHDRHVQRIRQAAAKT